MISDKEAQELVNEKIDTKNLKKHMYAVSAIMEGLAQALGEHEEKWRKTGLLHDIDYEETKDNPEKHAVKSVQILKNKLPDDALKAIKAHNHQYTKVKPTSTLDNALISADAASGLIVATALVMPNSKIDEVRVESVLKKFNDSSFAKNIDRDKIMCCRNLGLTKKEFIEISLNRLKEINDELGL